MTQVFTDAGSGSLSGNVTGSMVDLFAGYNFRIAPSFIVGGQGHGVQRRHAEDDGVIGCRARPRRRPRSQAA